MKYSMITFLLLSCLQVGLYAQNAVRNYKSHSSNGEHGILINYENASVGVEFCTANMVRIRTSWTGEFEAQEYNMVTTYDWPKADFNLEESDRSIMITSDLIKILITKAPFSVRIENMEGDLLFNSRGHYSENGKVTAKQELMPDEHFFGFGERMDFLDRRGKEVDLNVGRGELRPHIIGAYNVLEANYSPVPFFMSTRGYGIFLHNSYATNWDMGSSSKDSYSFQANGGELDYYFIYGPEFRDILNTYTDLTGKSPMMNRFAFGLHVGTYSGGTWGHEEMTSTQYVIALVRKFRELGIPIDILHLDSTWRIFGENGGKGATSFEWRETFDNPKAMFDSLYAEHISMVGLHVRPRFDNGKTLRLLDAAREKGYVYPENNNPGEFVNYFDQEAVDWWWENGVMRVAETGAMFLKTDEGSAFGRRANESDKTGPTGNEILRLHNIFPLVYAKAPYEKFQEYNGLRGMNHTREGYAGIQRYPFIFAGDWPSEWQYFEPVIKAGLNIGLSGVSYWTHCMGGFEHDADPELYIRWCQFGLMSPVSHLFGMDHPGYKEPWNYGEEALKIFRQYDLMRYSLVPYLYSTAWQNHQTGIPMMRALVLDNQEDENTYNITDQYMLGDHIMVCPVVTKGAKSRTLYLPEGRWYGHWDGQIYEGRQFVHVVTPLDQMPVFYREGSIIPRQEPPQYIGKEIPEKIILDIYPGEAESSFELYDDDGTSLEYQEGNYSLTSITYHVSGDGSSRISLKSTLDQYNLPDRIYSFSIRTSHKPEKIKVDYGKGSGKSIKKWTYDKEKGILTFEIQKKSDESLVISLN